MAVLIDQQANDQDGDREKPCVHGGDDHSYASGFFGSPVSKANAPSEPSKPSGISSSVATRNAHMSMRVVFDGAALLSGGISLSDALLGGA